MDTAPIADLLDLLQAVEGVTVPGGPDDDKLRASMEMGELDVPGVLVLVRGHTDDRLRGGTWQLQLVCVAPDLGGVRTLDQLATTYQLLTSVVDPLGDATFVTLTNPDGPALPGLSLPYDLPYEETP